MNLEIVKKTELYDGSYDSHIYDVYKIRRKYWLFNSYYHNKEDRNEPEFMMLRITMILIALGSTIAFFGGSTFIGSPIVLLTSFYLMKFSEKYTCSKYKNLHTCEAILNNKIKLGSSKNIIVKKVKLKKDTIYIETV